jgi:hypothetical protein
MEVLPCLAARTIYGLHDIFLPDDYPPEWRERFYNEQYLLPAFLFGGCGADEMLFASAYAAQYMKDELKFLWESEHITGRTM